MAHETYLDFPDWRGISASFPREQVPSQPILRELITALTPHPRGLRRWSVMRAIRTDRHRASRDIPQKFESEVESVFRKFSADTMDAHARVCALESAPFCRPQNTAGEVWALRPGKAEAWLGENLPAGNFSKAGGA